jgi:hypothetical protein
VTPEQQTALAYQQAFSAKRAARAKSHREIRAAIAQDLPIAIKPDDLVYEPTLTPSQK